MFFLTLELLYSGFLVIDVGAFHEAFHLPGEEFRDNTFNACSLG